MTVYAELVRAGEAAGGRVAQRAGDDRDGAVGRAAGGAVAVPAPVQSVLSVIAVW